MQLIVVLALKMASHQECVQQPPHHTESDETLSVYHVNTHATDCWLKYYLI